MYYMEVLMLISVLLILNIVVGLINLIMTSKVLDKKKKNTLFKQHDNLIDIENNVFEDLTAYCKERYNLDVFRCFDTDQISLAYKKDDKNVIILELKFPLRDRGSMEYQAAIEGMKEEIDDWRKQNA